VEQVKNEHEGLPGWAVPVGAPHSTSRRSFVSTLAVVGGTAPVLSSVTTPRDSFASESRSVESPNKLHAPAAVGMTDAITNEKIRRSRLSGPPVVTANATVVEMDFQGRLTTLLRGSNEWVCFPGNENVIGDVPMALDRMGMQWFMDLRARRPKPTNSSPGLIYMLCGALQHSYTDPFDRTSPPIPIGPHWMVLWPFDAAAAGLGTVMRDAGTMVMFAGTPYAHLHICGSPWDGNEYRPGDRAIRTLTYAHN
jgi:hypothetical protein